MLIVEAQEPHWQPNLEVAVERTGPGYVQVHSRMDLFMPRPAYEGGWVVILRDDAGARRATQADCPAVQPFLEGLASVDPTPLSVPGVSPPIRLPPLTPTHAPLYRLKGHSIVGRSVESWELETSGDHLGVIVERFLTDAEPCWSPFETAPAPQG